MSGDRERRALLERLQTELRDLRAGVAPPEPPPEALVALEAELVTLRATAARTRMKLAKLDAEVEQAQAEFHRLSDAVQRLLVDKLPGWDDAWTPPNGLTPVEVRARARTAGLAIIGVLVGLFLSLVFLR